MSTLFSSKKKRKLRHVSSLSGDGRKHVVGNTRGTSSGTHEEEASLLSYYMDEENQRKTTTIKRKAIVSENINSVDIVHKQDRDEHYENEQGGEQQQEGEKRIVVEQFSHLHNQVTTAGGKTTTTSTTSAHNVITSSSSTTTTDTATHQMAIGDTLVHTLDDLGLTPPLVTTCRELGFRKPTPVQRVIIPFLLQNRSCHTLALAETGSGKTAAFVLPILHHLAMDPYGIYAVIVTPTRELAKQIHQQVLALGSTYRVQAALVVGGLDMVRQSVQLDQQPHFCVATPGRLAELLRYGPRPPKLHHVRYLVLDEADRLLAANSGFERDVAELLLHCNTIQPTTSPVAAATTPSGEAMPKQKLQQQQQRRQRQPCQTLLFSATMTQSLESIEQMARSGLGRLPLRKFVIGSSYYSQTLSSLKSLASCSSSAATNTQSSDTTIISEADKTATGPLTTTTKTTNNSTPRIPAGLRQEYVFMPARVRDAYLLTVIRALVANGGRPRDSINNLPSSNRKKYSSDIRRANSKASQTTTKKEENDAAEEDGMMMARSAIVFVSTCERAALVSEILSQVGVDNVALHSLLSQNRRLAALAKFKSQQVLILVATDVASRGLDIPTVDLVINCELPRQATSYVHRVGRTARAGRRGRAISLVSEADVGLVHAAEKASGRTLEKCVDVTDDMALQMLGPVAKASRLAKMKLMDIGFEELVKKFRTRKERDRRERERLERALSKIES